MRVEIIPSAQRRRWSVAEKVSLVEEAMQATLALIMPISITVELTGLAVVSTGGWPS